MAEVFSEFTNVLIDDNGVRYRAHACGAPMSDGKWQGWVEFLPLDGSPPIRTGRETTQPNRTDVEYWATGLTAVYFEGALQRALQPLVVHHTSTDAPAFEEPAPRMHTTVTPTAARDAVLDPFAIYEKGGAPLLRRQLAALAPWHLVNIIDAYDLSADPDTVLNRLPAAELIDTIVSSVEQENRAFDSAG